jgi:hypothetical protein
MGMAINYFLLFCGALALSTAKVMYTCGYEVLGLILLHDLTGAM